MPEYRLVLTPNPYWIEDGAFSEAQARDDAELADLFDSLMGEIEKGQLDKSAQAH